MRIKLYARDSATGELLVSSPINTTGQKYAWYNHLVAKAKDKRVLGYVEGNKDAPSGVPPVLRIFDDLDTIL